MKVSEGAEIVTLARAPREEEIEEESADAKPAKKAPKKEAAAPEKTDDGNQISLI